MSTKLFHEDHLAHAHYKPKAVPRSQGQPSWGPLGSKHVIRIPLANPYQKLARFARSLLIIYHDSKSMANFQFQIVFLNNESLNSYYSLSRQPYQISRNEKKGCQVRYLFQPPQVWGRMSSKGGGGGGGGGIALESKRLHYRIRSTNGVDRAKRGARSPTQPMRARAGGCSVLSVEVSEVALVFLDFVVRLLPFTYNETAR